MELSERLWDLMIPNDFLAEFTTNSDHVGVRVELLQEFEARGGPVRADILHRRVGVRVSGGSVVERWFRVGL